MSGKATIKTRCPVCNAKYRVSARSIGHRARCVKCNTTFRVAEVEKNRPPTEVEKNRPPTEEDILKWLNEGVDEDHLANRPRVVSGGSSRVEPPSEQDLADEEVRTTPIRAVASQASTSPDRPAGRESAPPDTTLRFRKTG